MRNQIKFLLLCCVAVSLSACVTQSYENENTPVVENKASQNEIALTRISLGLGYLKMGNTTQAKINLEKAKKHGPNLVQVYSAFAHYYEVVGEPEQAIEAYEKALSIKPQDADTLNNYGVFLCRQGQYAASEKQILKAIAVPSYIYVSDSYENLAICQLEAKDFDKAEHYLNKSIQHSPSNASAILQMTQLQYAKADYKKAAEYFARYEKASRRFNPESLALAYKIYQKQRQNKIAKNYAAMMVKMFPNSYQSKQYILNGLRTISADQLANEYKELQNKGKPAKRVVVLSPKKMRDKQTLVSAYKGKGKADSVKRMVLHPKNALSPVAKSNTKSANQRKKSNTSEQKQLSDKQTLVSKYKGEATADTEKRMVLHSKVDQTIPSISTAKPPVTANSQIVSKSKKNRTPEQKQGQKMMSLPIHVVEKGEGLFFISKKYNIKIKSLLRWNKLKQSSTIKIGQIIYLADPKKAATH